MQALRDQRLRIGELVPRPTGLEDAHGDRRFGVQKPRAIGLRSRVCTSTTSPLFRLSTG